MRLTKYFSFPALVSLFFSTLILASAAIYNGYPLMDVDSGAYISMSYSWLSIGDRPIFYPLFLTGTRLMARSNWSAVWAQCFLTVLLLRWTMLALGLKRINVCAPIIFFCLTVSTAISWHTIQLMPDAFTALLGLASFLLLFHVQSLGYARAFIVAVIFFLALVTHYSHLLLVLAAVIMLVAILRFSNSTVRPKKYLLLLVTLIAVVPFTVAVNAILGMNFLYSNHTYGFVMGRMVDDGILVKYLEKSCPTERYFLCAKIEDIKSHSGVAFVWSLYGPFFSPEDRAHEFKEIIWKSILVFPKEHLRSAIASSVRQLVTFRWVGHIPLEQDKFWWWTIVRHESDGALSFFESRQQKVLLGFDKILLDKIYFFAYFFSLVSLVVFYFISLRSATFIEFRMFALTIFCFLAANAIVCGVLSGVYDRYQSRVAWLPTFVLLLVLNKAVELHLNKEALGAARSSTLA